MVANATKEAYDSKRRITRVAERTAKVGGGVIIAAVALCGPELGFAFAKHYTDKLPAELKQTETKVSLGREADISAESKLNAYINGLGGTCAMAAGTYLPGGINQSFSTGQAEISLQYSRLCLAKDISVVSRARNLESISINTQDQLDILEKRLKHQELDIKHGPELWEWPLYGLAAEVGLIASYGIMSDD